jgi:hypothetical protein
MDAMEGKPMSLTPAKDYFARECVKLAQQVEPPELREKLLTMAREWMQAVMAEEDATMVAPEEP